MDEYEVRDVVCDYGVYEDGELKLILNSRRIALQIVELLKARFSNINESTVIDFSRSDIYNLNSSAIDKNI